MGIVCFASLAFALTWLLRSAVNGLRTSSTFEVLGTTLGESLRTGLVEPVYAWVQSAAQAATDDILDGGV